jgi:hypothetical protein
MKNVSILYVDEDPAALRAVGHTLRSAGHSVTVARNAADGVLLLKLCSFDILLLDCVPAFTWLTEEAKRMHQNLLVAVCTDVPGYFRLPSVDTVVPRQLPPPAFLERIAELLAPADAAGARA